MALLFNLRGEKAFPVYNGYSEHDWNDHEQRGRRPTVGTPHARLRLTFTGALDLQNKKQLPQPEHPYKQHPRLS